MLAVQFRILSLAAFPLSQLYEDGDYRRGLAPMGVAAVAAVDSVLRTQPWRLPTLVEVVAAQTALFGGAE